VIDLGQQQTEWGIKPLVDLRWQLGEKDKNGRRFQVMKRYTLSLHNKATLCKDLSTWRGRKFTLEEKLGFDLELLIGRNCQLQIAHNIKDDGRTYANVQTIVPASKDAPLLAVEDYTREIHKLEQEDPHKTGETPF
jgi:hypothetical protein